MYDSDYWYEDAEPPKKEPDPYQIKAEKDLYAFFDENKDDVFFSKQLEVMYEDTYYHWITNRAVRGLLESGYLVSAPYMLNTGNNINILYHPKNRYYKRKAKRLIDILERSHTREISFTIGQYAELMFMECFANSQFIMKGRETNEYEGKKWAETNHNLDFIFEKDSIAYGIEVKNQLNYMKIKEWKIKKRMCEYLEIKPVFIVRMMPTEWIRNLYKDEGFTLVFKYQLYPLNFKELVKEIRNTIGFPADTPRTIEQGTMQRFLRWHEKNLHYKIV